MNNPNDFVIQQGTLIKYTGAGGDVVIPAGVTTIGDTAFKACDALISVTVPAGVTQIGKDAFCACTKLQSVQLPDGLVTVGEGAFWYCESLTSIVIPGTVSEIGKRAFGYCDKLEVVTILSAKTKGVSGAFYGGVQPRFHVKTMTALPAAMRVQAVCSFAEHLAEYDEEERKLYCKYIKSNADKLADCVATNPELMHLLCANKMITAKEAPAFLDAVQKGGNVEAIAIMLEYNANVLTPQQKDRAQQKKEADEETVIDRKIQRLEQKGIEGATLVIAGSSFETFKSGELKAYIEANGGTIGKTVSAKTDYLVVKDLESAGGKKAKAEALGIEVITERQLNEMTGRVFEIDAKNTLVRYYGAGGDLVIPDNVTKIGKKAFENCNVLTSVTIPEKVKEIGLSAFKDCRNLTSVTLPSKLTKIGNFAFLRCTSLQTVTIPGKVKTIGDQAFSECRSLSSVTICEGLTTITKFSFGNCSSLTSVAIPKSVTAIEEFAFGWCSSLTALTIPANVTYIHDNAFFELENLTIRGDEGSCAQEFAKAQKFQFLAM